MNRMWMLLPALLLLSCVGWASTPSVRVVMRDNGYTMGDFLQMQVEIPLDPGQVLDTDSLPLTGRVRPWLDLHELRWMQKDRMLSLDLTWQLFATVEIAQKLHTPPIALRTRQGQTLQIPAQAFYYSPVLPHPMDPVSRRDNLPPFKADERTPLAAAGLLLLLALCSGLGWLWLHDRLFWWPRRPGPMTLLARRFRSFPAQGVLQHAQLRDIHEALNRSAGQSLYPHTLTQLFVVAPYLRVEQSAIAGFFECSWQVFHAGLPPTLRAEEVRRWVLRCARDERLYRRRRPA